MRDVQLKVAATVVPQHCDPIGVAKAKPSSFRSLAACFASQSNNVTQPAACLLPTHASQPLGSSSHPKDAVGQFAPHFAYSSHGWLEIPSLHILFDELSSSASNRFSSLYHEVLFAFLTNFPSSHFSLYAFDYLSVRFVLAARAFLSFLILLSGTLRFSLHAFHRLSAEPQCFYACARSLSLGDSLALQ